MSLVFTLYHLFSLVVIHFPEYRLKRSVSITVSLCFNPNDDPLSLLKTAKHTLVALLKQRHREQLSTVIGKLEGGI